MQRGTPRESDRASRREEACLLNPCNVVAQLVTSQPVTVVTTVTFFSHSDVLGPSRITRKYLASSIVHSALEHVLCCFPLFANFASMAAGPVPHLWRASVPRSWRYTSLAASGRAAVSGVGLQPRRAMAVPSLDGHWHGAPSNNGRH